MSVAIVQSGRFGGGATPTYVRFSTLDGGIESGSGPYTYAHPTGSAYTQHYHTSNLKRASGTAVTITCMGVRGANPRLNFAMSNDNTTDLPNFASESANGTVFPVQIQWRETTNKQWRSIDLGTPGADVNNTASTAYFRISISTGDAITTEYSTDGSSWTTLSGPFAGPSGDLYPKVAWGFEDEAGNFTLTHTGMVAV
jgi:hypothetical protein